MKPAQAYALFVVGLMIGLVLAGIAVGVLLFEYQFNALMWIVIGGGGGIGFARLLRKNYSEGKLELSPETIIRRETSPGAFYLFMFLCWFGFGILLVTALLALLALCGAVPLDIVPLLGDE